MDTEQQVRLHFLEEAESYFEQLERTVLGLAHAENRRGLLDEAMRAAHSIKGSAGMMGFMPLSRAAHYLEDAFKILQARQTPVDTELETYLLQGIDCLRSIQECHCKNLDIDEAWMQEWAFPVFERLQQCLGELTEEDENQLLAASENIDVGILVFTNGVEEILEHFTQTYPRQTGEDLRQTLLATSTRLMEFGLVGQIEPFIALCTAIQATTFSVTSEALPDLAAAALAVWQRAQALAVLGRAEQISAHFDWQAPDQLGIESPSIADPTISLSNSPEPLAADFALNLDDLTALSASLDALNIDALSIDTLSIPELPINLDDINALQATIAKIDLPELPEPVAIATPTPPPKRPVSPPPKTSKVRSVKDATVRISVEQLRQINTLFGSLILDRNAISLRLEQLQNLLLLLHERMDSLQEFNRELRRWYDYSSVNQPTIAPLNDHNDFDSLELDQYSGLHLLAQEQMETIAKLQEVIADLDLTSQEMRQASHNLNYNSRSLQSRITRTQMRPLSEVVGRLPRVMRDLSIKYNKQVDLHIEGENTLFERFALDVLADPINHLLRNAFDHGIESPEERQRLGKSPNGRITIQAAQRGNNAILKIIDDGKGISTEKIKQRLREHRLPESQISEFSEAELLEFIFDAGFSTAEAVTELSGRGVGMDVVRANLQQIQGDVQVSTIAGQGTTFTITLPLTSSIFRIMLLEANGFLFATPMDAIKTIQPIQSLPIRTEAGRSLTQWQEQTLTIHKPEEYWQFPRPTRLVEMTGKPIINQPLVMIFGDGNQYHALQVSRYWSEQEVAIRPINSPIPLPIGFSGITTLGDGRIVPLVDPIAICNAIASSIETASTHNPMDTAGTPIVKPIETSQHTILIVDDSAYARRYLAISLENAGYRVEQAKDGQEAIERLVAGLSVAAIVCDVEMPRLDGYGVLNELQTKPELRRLPIAMLTSRSSDKHRKLAMQLGAKAYFSKPYNEQELLQTLSTLIEQPLATV